MAATDVQMQEYCDQRIRVRAEQIRALLAAMQDDKAAIDDVYARASDANSPWADARTDGPPHLLVSSDILSYNTFIMDLIAAIQNDAQWPVVYKACVRPVGFGT
jgi:hypothetical protein